jgi:DNA-binding CsgD family transcriptional regulator
VNRGNRGLQHFTDAIGLAREAGERETAAALVDTGLRDLSAFGAWAQLGLMLVAESALADGWGDPAAWLESCERVFSASGRRALAERCGMLLRSRPSPWARRGITRRESEVLALLTEGLANREIAERLGLSTRTIEKHVESLLRKTGSHSRTQLVRLAVLAQP